MIDVQNLSYRYPKSDAQTLKALTFHVEPGEIFGFLGPSGSGKSTTQRILIGLLRGYDGSVRLFDQEIKSLDRRLYQDIGVGFELPNAYHRLTALENLEFFASLYPMPKGDLRGLLNRFGLLKDANTRVSQFSKGMKMRLNFCRALLSNPQLLFLDEPTSGQDPTHAHILRERILEEKAAGKTIFLTTHNMQEAAELCDRVAFIAEGQLRLIGQPQALKKQYGSPSLKLIYQGNDGPISEEFSLQNLSENQAFLGRLRQEEILSLHSQEADLESVFMQITGRTQSWH